MNKLKKLLLTIIFTAVTFSAFAMNQDVKKKYSEYYVSATAASQDGEFEFSSLYSRSLRKAFILCGKTTEKNETDSVVLLETEYPVSWFTSSIIFSDISETVYFYVNGSDDGNGVFKYQGLYSCKKENGEFNSRNLKRYHIPMDWMFEDAINFYLGDGKENYQGFLDYVYSFSDSCEKTFCIPDSNGKMLAGVDAVKYCKENNKIFSDAYNFLNLYIKRIENNEITNQSAFTINGNPQMINGFLQKSLNDAFFLKNSDGIWVLRATNKESKKTDSNGNEISEWGPAYFNIYFLEDNKGESSRITPAGLDLIQLSSDKKDFSVNNGFLVLKNRTGQPYYVFRKGDLNSFNSYDEAVAFTNSTELKTAREDKTVSDAKTNSSENNKFFFLILFVVILCLAVFELIYVFVLKSKIYKTHLNKKDKKLIFKIQDEERSKVSKDIHDSVVQNIRAIRLDAEMLEVKEGSNQRKEKVVEEMTNVITLLRNICYNLSPAELSLAENMDNANVELLSVIDTLSKQFTAKTKIPCSISLEKDIVLPELDVEVSRNVVRIVQECFNNIEKHSFATRVQILVKNEMKDNVRKLILFIIDDGIGCEIKNLTKKKTHFGIRNMIERMNMVGGSIEFFSEPNEGLSIQLQIPYGE